MAFEPLVAVAVAVAVAKMLPLAVLLLLVRSELALVLASLVAVESLRVLPLALVFSQVVVFGFAAVVMQQVGLPNVLYLAIPLPLEQEVAILARLLLRRLWAIFQLEEYLVLKAAAVGFSSE